MSPGNLQFEWHEGTKVLELEFEDAFVLAGELFDFKETAFELRGGRASMWVAAQGFIGW